MTSNTSFTFPPPPPPPPRALGPESSIQTGNHGRQNRGSWGGPGNINGGGRRGGDFPRGRGNSRGQRPYHNGPARNGGSYGHDSRWEGNMLPTNGVFPSQAIRSSGCGMGGQGDYGNQRLQHYGTGLPTQQYGSPSASTYSDPYGLSQPWKRVRLSSDAKPSSGLPGPIFPQYLQKDDDQPKERKNIELSVASNGFHKKPSQSVPAPSVPNFLSGLPGLSALADNQKSTETIRRTKSKQRMSNTLGLTPNLNTEDRDESEDEDVDEESVVAPSLPRDKLVVTYRGRTANLSDPAELAAWIEERRRKFPTKAKAEENRKEREKIGLERQAAREAAIKQRNAAREAEAKTRSNATDKSLKRGKKGKCERAIRSSSNKDSAKSEISKDQNSVEKAREKALRKIKAQQDKLKRMEEALLNDDQHIPSTSESKYGGTTPQQLVDIDNNVSATSDSDLDLDDWTSSSGSSSSSSKDSSSENGDSAPEETTTRPRGPVRVPPPAREKPKPQKCQPRPCKFFAANGHCRQGKRCRYAHVAANGKIVQNAAAREGGGTKKGRISLWQRLVDKEKEEEEARIVDAIKIIGDRGMLNDPMP
jgi:hypothetical protein